MAKRFPRREYHVPLFDEEGYERKLCPSCNQYFWTVKADLKNCGEATSEGCALSTFINNAPTRKAYSLREMRETFLSFFEKLGHQRMKPYPVVSRWREDLYLTSASIVDFQPYVTNGIVPPPANPLVISQPCIRLVDVDNTGPTFGRHLTIFEMGGHHAFNYPDKDVYWKDETVRLHHRFATEELGIPTDDVIYKEDVWSGGGNAGPDLETIVRGLELDTLVFMKFKVINGDFVELPIRTVDTGYGIERYTWISQGSATGFHAFHGNVLEAILRMADFEKVDQKILAEVAKFAGSFGYEKQTKTSLNSRKQAAKHLGMELSQLQETLQPLEKVFAVCDHTKSLIFMLAEGVVPSNVQEGYLTRLLIRRTLRLHQALGIEDRVDDIMTLQIKEWSPDFPYLKEMQEEILNLLSVEREKFEKTLKRGKALVSRIIKDLKTQGKRQIPKQKLLELWDSHGLPPEAVKEATTDSGIQTNIPANFYKQVAELHLEASPKEREVDEERLHLVSDLPATRLLYYEDQYMTEFKSKVLRVLEGAQVVLEETAFYPEGGGQPADQGILTFKGTEVNVVNVYKIGKVIIHELQGTIPEEGVRVQGRIDWLRRNSLMRAHTSTHLIMGAARRVLGRHVWQTGTQKNVESARLDISHYQKLNQDEVDRIEALANQSVTMMTPIHTEWLPREVAEADYGFRLYQGGAVPGKQIRVVKIGEWEVEACGGTHVKNTGEIGFIKIIRTERVQDGVERIVYSTAEYAVKESQRLEKMLRKLGETLSSPLEKLQPTVERLLREWKDVRRDNERLQKALAKGGSNSLQPVKVSGYETLIGSLDWITDEQGLVSTASEFVKTSPNTIAVLGGIVNGRARIVVSTSLNAINAGITARKIAAKCGAILGGGGSGTKSFAQAGGPLKEKVTEALEAAKKLIVELGDRTK